MWPFSRPPIVFEQAVYGSFPFWHRGYDLLGQSPGCRPEWIAALKETCQRLGERLRNASPPGGLISRWLDDGTWLLIHPFSPGRDDMGRPDAAAFHGVFLDSKNAQYICFDPFRLACVFREDWKPEASTLEPGTIRLPRPQPSKGSDDPRVSRIVEAISQGRRVLVESAEPIDPLANQVWHTLPRWLRHRRSLATWAYTDAGLFDLIGLPRLTGIDVSDPHLLVLANPLSGTVANEQFTEGHEGITSC